PTARPRATHTLMSPPSARASRAGAPRLPCPARERTRAANGATGNGAMPDCSRRRGLYCRTMVIPLVLVVLLALAFQPRSILGGMFAGLTALLILIGGLLLAGSLLSP